MVLRNINSDTANPYKITDLKKFPSLSHLVRASDNLFILYLKAKSFEIISPKKKKKASIVHFTTLY